jgi:hypothetical protein
MPSDRDDFNRQRGDLLSRVRAERDRQQLSVDPARVVDADAKLETDPAITGQPPEPPTFGPLDKAPALFFPYDEKRALLAGAFAGVELGAWDNRVLDWLANADGDTVVAVVGMVRRAIADATERAWTDSAEHGG